MSWRQLAARAPSTGPDKLNLSQVSSILDLERSVLPRKVAQVRVLARACGLDEELTARLVAVWARLNARRTAGR
ncbi:hypothetical protein [Kutzneria buriramensis]|uniref:Uncharacterized protein n=1 Tax=Kutzneria buriramensis TaxID=1045776 RepID=A0A3E0I8X8_9PSEU|nr:hypothetical protein [Kutzneria buriramensis]REH55228.1 hypothetical protein BCF44_101245 [Kutzneria buriramensis]